MPVRISREDLPNVQYSMMKHNDEAVMMVVAQSGVILMFVDRNENLFVPWDEVVEFAASSSDKLPVEPVSPEIPAPDNPLGISKRGGTREIKK